MDVKQSTQKNQASSKLKRIDTAASNLNGSLSLQLIIHKNRVQFSLLNSI